MSKDVKLSEELKDVNGLNSIDKYKFLCWAKQAKAIEAERDELKSTVDKLQVILGNLQNELKAYNPPKP